MTATTVKVKPLVWRQVDDDDFEAAKYNCHIVSDGKGWGLAPLGWPCLGDHPYPTLEAAKAAAQADYEASILSAIEVPDLDAHIGAVLTAYMHKAASRIEKLEAESEKLKETLSLIAACRDEIVWEEGDGHKEIMEAITLMANMAHTALTEEKTND